MEQPVVAQALGSFNGDMLLECLMRFFARSVLFGVSAAFALSTALADEQQSRDVLTYHYDTWRTGWNSTESSLAPAVISNGSFGLLYKVEDLDEQVDAQPLILSKLPVGGQSRNVVFVVTEYNTLYAIDADSGAKIATQSFGTPVPGTVGDPTVGNPPHPALPTTVVCGNRSDHLGISSTPVINDARDTLYLIAAVWSGNSFDYILHAVDLTTIGDPQHPLADKVPPVKVGASGTLTDGTPYAFQSKFARQRSALLLSKDRVYAGFGTMCDNNPDVSRGWLFAWDAHSLVPVAPLLTDHRPVSKVGSGRLGSIWMSGYGPSADADGHVFVVTGNSKLPKPGETLPSVSVGPNTYLSDSVVKFGPELEVLDWFTPSDPEFGQKIMDGGDHDLGSGGVVLLPDTDVTKSLPKKLAAAAGKTGQMYLMDRDSMGKFDPAGVDHVLDQKKVGFCYCGPSYFEGADGAPRIVSSGNDGLEVWRIASSGRSVSLVQDYASPEPLGTTNFQTGFFTSVSSNGRAPNSAIIWAIRRPQKCLDPPNTCQTAGDPPQLLVLHAFDAKDGAHLCAADAGPWPMNHEHAAAPNAVPVVANGKVFVASYKGLRVFGVGGSPVCGEKLAVAAQDAQAAHAELGVEAPTAGQLGVAKGIVIDVSDNKMHLKSGDKTIEIDLSEVLQSGRYGNIDPGKPVTVLGTSNTDGSLIADLIYSGD